MADEIVDSSELAESEWDSQSEPRDLTSDLSATAQPTEERIEFHVQMRGYTQRDMDDLIVEAAARLIVGKHNERSITKAIEEKCVELLNDKATKALDGVTSEIIDQPLTPNFGEKKPVTMREFLGLYGREFLMTPVDADGKPGRDHWGRSRARIEWLVSRHLDARFEAEIKKATQAAVTEITRELKARHEAILEAEKQRLRDALAKVTGASP